MSERSLPERAPTTPTASPPQNAPTPTRVGVRDNRASVDRLQKGVGNQAVLRLGTHLPRYLRTRLDPADANLSARGDPDEIAADRVADAATGERAVAGVGADAPTDLPSGGAPLPPTARTYFERRLESDLGNVKLHHGQAAADASRALGAEAFTVGDDISFAQDRYAPDSPAGFHLLAHELAHVSQQRSAGPSIQRQQLLDDEFAQTDAAAEQSDTTAAQPPLKVIAPVPAPPAPVSLERILHVEIPQIVSSGELAADTLTRTIVFDEPVIGYSPITIYASPRLSLGGPKGASGPLTPQELAALAGAATREPDRGAGFGPVLTPIPKPTEAEGVSHPDVGKAVVQGEYVLTSRYVKFAVGAGSCGLVETESGITLLDAGVGKDAHAEISTRVLKEISDIVGKRGINEVLLSHLHEDHTSLLPELAKKFRIGSIRLNAFQFSDPRMIELLEKVAAAERSRIEAETRAHANKNRAAIESQPKESKLPVDPAAREAAWEATVKELVGQAIARSPINLEIMNPDGNTLSVVKARLGSGLGKIVLPAQEGAPAQLRRGHIETDASGMPRLTLTHPDMVEDLSEFADKKAADPGARVADELADAHENSYVIILSGGSRLLVLPDKRAPDIGGRRPAGKGSFADLLKDQVEALNAELKTLGLNAASAPQVIQAWEMTHHAQVGWFTTVGEMNDLIANLRKLTRLDLPGGGKTLDVVIVSGQGDPTKPAVRSLIDPTTVWFLRENGVEVIITTGEQSAQLIEVALRNGKTIAALGGARVYAGKVVSEATLRRSELAIERLKNRVDQIEAEKRILKADMDAGRLSKGDYNKRAKDLNSQKKPFNDLTDQIKEARDAYQKEFLEKLRPTDQEGPPKPAGEGEGPGAEKRAELQRLLGDKLLEGLPAEAGPKIDVFDEAAMRVLKLEGGGKLSPQQMALIEAVEQADVLRARLAATESIEARAEVIQSLSKLVEAIESYAKASPYEATRKLFDSMAENIRAEMAATATPSTADGVTKLDAGDYLITQRTSFGKSTGAERVRWIADKSNAPLGALMVYTTFRKQKHLEKEMNVGEVSGLTAMVGTLHNFYGFTIGVRMMTQVRVSPIEFGVLAVFDFVETASRDAASPALKSAAVTYSAIRNTLQLGVMALGTWMMKRPNWKVALIGFVMQFGVDKALEMSGLYDALERSFEFLPNDVFKVSQRLRDLMREYGVIAGLIELSLRSKEELASIGGTNEKATKDAIAAELSKYRSHALDVEKNLLDAFAGAYAKADTIFAGLPELDVMRERFVTLQVFIHGADEGLAQRSKAQAIAAFAQTERHLSLAGKSVEQIGEMDQWNKINTSIEKLTSRLTNATDPDWKAAIKDERELQMMLRNARYRLDPASLGLRTAPLIPPGPARDEYARLLDACEQRAEALHDQIVTSIRHVVPVPAAQAPAEPKPPGESALRRAEEALWMYKTALAMQPPLPGGLTAERLRTNSADVGEAYKIGIADDNEYRVALERLQFAEELLTARVAAAVLANPAIAEISDPIGERVRNLKEKKDASVERRIQRGFLFAEEIAARVAELRTEENKDLAVRLGDTAKPLSATEAAAIKTTDLGKVLFARGAAELLKEVPYASLAGPDGYMVGIYRYVDDTTKESDNVLLGDTGRLEDIAVMESDEPMSKRVYVCLNRAAQIKFGPLTTGGSSADHAYLGYKLFDNEMDCLKKVKLSDIKP